jgi:hypothetical protein
MNKKDLELNKMLIVASILTVLALTACGPGVGIRNAGNSEEPNVVLLPAELPAEIANDDDNEEQEIVVVLNVENHANDQVINEAHEANIEVIEVQSETPVEEIIAAIEEIATVDEVTIQTIQDAIADEAEVITLEVTPEPQHEEAAPVVEVVPQVEVVVIPVITPSPTPTPTPVIELPKHCSDGHGKDGSKSKACK